MPPLSTAHIPPRHLGDGMEVHTLDLPRGCARHALFDFDGTLSLLRSGWQEVMIDQCLAQLKATGTDEADEELRGICVEFISRLTGAQTIYQMMELVTQIESRGGCARTAVEYKHQYLDLLHERIGHRLRALRSGQDSVERYLVRGSQRLLQGLRQRGVVLYLASGTDEPFVVEEAALLHLAPYFEGRIFGAGDQPGAFSKKKIIHQILDDHGLRGPELLVFGDGYVEIENGREAGGITVGAATREDGTDAWDPWKRQRLLQVGADIIVPHWGEADALLRYLFAE